MSGKRHPCQKTVSMVRRTPVPVRTPVGALFAMRKDAHLPLREAASCIGISAATLFRAENGRLPDVLNAIRIARFYETTVEALWGDQVRGQASDGK